MSNAAERFSRLTPRGLGVAFSLMFLIFSSLQAFGQGAARSEKHPAPTVRIVFFTPADVSMPAGARERVTKIAEYTEKFFFKWMNRWGYPPAVKTLFQREQNGMVELLSVRGNKRVSSGKYSKPDYAQEVIDQAARQHHIAGKGIVWWIFIYLGDRPVRFADFRGVGESQDGGWAMVNYDTLPGEIQPDYGMAAGYNGQIYLKGMIHELGHAFGLFHEGPDIALGLGNSLMGPITLIYTSGNNPEPEQVYLSACSAAVLWKHPIFSGIAMDHVRLPSVKLVGYKAAYDPTKDAVTISGKLIADQSAHSVVVIDDQSRTYWNRGYAARIGSDGLFQVRINKPDKVAGQYRIMFCFDNGFVTGDGIHATLENRGDIKESYSFQNDAVPVWRFSAE